MPKNNIILSLIISLQTILIYSIITIIIEYFYIFKPCQINTNITNNTKTLMFFVIFVLILSLNLFFKKLPKTTLFLIIIFVLSTISVFMSHQFHLSFIKKTQEFKICSLSSPWGIQGKEIIIYGQNFSPEWQPGQVFVNDFPMRILHWTENKITVEQPVPNSYFKGQLFVINFDGQKSNSKPFEIVNPDNLSKIDQYKLRYKFYKDK